MERETELERVREVVRVKNEIDQLRIIEEHFARERAAFNAAEVDDVIGSARESIRKYERHLVDLLRRRRAD